MMNAATLLHSSPTARAACPISVQLHVRFGTAVNPTRQRIERNFGDAVQRPLVHLVEREIHYPRQQTLDPQASHQIAECRVLAQRYEGAEIAVTPGFDRPAGEAPLHLVREVRGLLVRRLSTRRNDLAVISQPRASGAIADCKDVWIARRLQVC